MAEEVGGQINREERERKGAHARYSYVALRTLAIIQKTSTGERINAKENFNNR